MRHACALALLTAGVGVLLMCALALLVLDRPYGRLHALAPATSVGVPLVALAAAVETGPGRAALKLLFIALFSAVGGPATTTAVARAQARRASGPRKESRR
ncbi:monovalent cation/H(+) antiporter subunit G [Streptomyces sp. NPDC046465]|uniref:monovalent cation/H(+) antiporter subunit G n=1 Tax=Streptomyces sp. NPDC046465 TaxID=3155810 RepID=UPI0033F0DE16